MIDSRLRLSVFHDDNGTFSDKTEQAVDFSRDNFSTTLNATEDYLYIGFYKPINNVFVEMVTANTNANTLAFEYYNGTTWAELTARDLTAGFTRSGYMVWSKPTDWAETEIDETEMYWVRVRPSVTHSATTFGGVNLVFADDYDLQQEFPDVLTSGFVPADASSHIKTHVGVRNQIIQDLRARGYLKLTAAGQWQNITPWDLLDIEEIKQCAVYLALSKIFFIYSDAANDIWMTKSREYASKYTAGIQGVKLTVDGNDDGVSTANERKSQVRRMVR